MGTIWAEKLKRARKAPSRCCDFLIRPSRPPGAAHGAGRRVELMAEEVEIDGPCIGEWFDRLMRDRRKRKGRSLGAGFHIAS